MSRLRVGNFSLSLDGFGAGPDQSPDNPLGVGGAALHDWFIPSRTFQRVHGKEGGTSGVDDDFAARAHANVGAWIMGRNMFGPVRGPWPDERWTGWWGDNPPFHCPVFVLTHHDRAPVSMAGGTESECGWCKDRWGLSWQITPRVLSEALAAGGAEAKRAFEAMMQMKKIDVAAIEAARRG
jgi:dihydrofolate reductase